MDNCVFVIGILPIIQIPVLVNFESSRCASVLLRVQASQASRWLSFVSQKAHFRLVSWTRPNALADVNLLFRTRTQEDHYDKL